MGVWMEIFAYNCWLFLVHRSSLVHCWHAVGVEKRGRESLETLIKSVNIIIGTLLRLVCRNPCHLEEVPSSEIDPIPDTGGATLAHLSTTLGKTKT